MVVRESDCLGMHNPLQPLPPPRNSDSPPPLYSTHHFIHNRVTTYRELLDSRDILFMPPVRHFWLALLQGSSDQYLICDGADNTDAYESMSAHFQNVP